MQYKYPKIVAEIGCNHKGDFEIARELIRLAKDSGADYAKFQKRTPEELLTQEAYNTPHAVPYNAYGDTYGKHREYLEFSAAQHAELKQYAESIDIGYATSVWDMTSAREIAALHPDYIKIPSACNNNTELIQYLIDNYSGDIHISLGMTTRTEEAALYALFDEVSKKRLVVYSCTSGYPVDFSDVCLLEISRIRETYGHAIGDIGFSGHHLGIAIDVAAYTLGAQWIERHFTKDRTWKGTDHAASLEPGGLSKLVRDIKATHAALSYKKEDILDIEITQREKLKYKPH